MHDIISSLKLSCLDNIHASHNNQLRQFSTLNHLMFPLQDAQSGTREPGRAGLFNIPLPRFGADDTPKVLPRVAAPTLEPVDGVGSHTGPWLAPEFKGFGL